MAALVDLIFALALLLTVVARFPALLAAIRSAVTALRGGAQEVTPAGQAPASSVTCPGCRTRSPSNARFCHYCGRNLISL